MKGKDITKKQKQKKLQKKECLYSAKEKHITDNMQCR